MKKACTVLHKAVSSPGHVMNSDSNVSRNVFHKECVIARVWRFSQRRAGKVAWLVSLYLAALRLNTHVWRTPNLSHSLTHTNTPTHTPHTLTTQTNSVLPHTHTRLTNPKRQTSVIPLHTPTLPHTPHTSDEPQTPNLSHSLTHTNTPSHTTHRQSGDQTQTTNTPKHGHVQKMLCDLQGSRFKVQPPDKPEILYRL